MKYYLTPLINWSKIMKYKVYASIRFTQAYMYIDKNLYMQQTSSRCTDNRVLREQLTVYRVYQMLFPTTVSQFI